MGIIIFHILEAFRAGWTFATHLMLHQVLPHQSPGSRLKITAFVLALTRLVSFHMDSQFRPIYEALITMIATERLLASMRRNVRFQVELPAEDLFA
jgi:hypothetical protein